LQGSNHADLKPDHKSQVLYQSNYELPLGRSGLVLIKVLLSRISQGKVRYVRRILCGAEEEDAG
jgi:hypothetical protein